MRRTIYRTEREGGGDAYYPSSLYFLFGSTCVSGYRLSLFYAGYIFKTAWM